MEKNIDATKCVESMDIIDLLLNFIALLPFVKRDSRPFILLLFNTHKENLFSVVEKVIFSGNAIFHNRRLTQKYHYTDIHYLWPQYGNIKLMVEAKI